MFLKKLKIAFVLVLTSCVFTASKPVVILIHGSFAVQEPWARPYGDFYQELESQAFGFGRKLVPFAWSGSPTAAEIFIAAMRLIRLVESYPADEEIILIGHSHGGNVINLASRFIRRVDLFPYTQEKLKEIVQDLENPAQCWDKNKPQDIAKKTNDITIPGNIGLSIAPTTRQVISAATGVTTGIDITTVHVSDKNTQSILHKKYIFDEVYLIATPVDNSRFKPNMGVIGCLYNLFSTGDMVQRIGGAYDQIYAHDQDGIFNFSVMLKDSGHFGSDYPTHSTMHSPIIGRWILHIPELAHVAINNKNAKSFGGLFENFDGQLCFEEGKIPEYKRA